MRKSGLILLGVSCLLVAPAWGQWESGSDGSDGPFVPGSSIEIDLSKADSGPGSGKFDAQRWAVVFNYTAIIIPENVTVTFKNHPSGAPVVWLAQEDVSISGRVVLDGEGGHHYAYPRTYSQPGPGGFRGGRGARDAVPPSAGFGPQGGSYQGGKGNFEYGTSELVPVIGGSGGGGLTSYAGPGGGAGGGAILVASSTRIVLDGTIQARGGDGGFSDEPRPRGGPGSGGAIRLVSNEISGHGYLRAEGGTRYGPDYAGAGRIRVEAYRLALDNPSSPPYTFGAPSVVFQPLDAPTVRVTRIDENPVPEDPRSKFLPADVMVNSRNSTIYIEARNVEPGLTADIRVVPQVGSELRTISTPLQGSFELSTARAFIEFPPGVAVVQVRIPFQRP